MHHFPPLAHPSAPQDARKARPSALEGLAFLWCRSVSSVSLCAADPLVAGTRWTTARAFHALVLGWQRRSAPKPGLPSPLACRSARQRTRLAPLPAPPPANPLSVIRRPSQRQHACKGPPGCCRAHSDNLWRRECRACGRRHVLASRGRPRPAPAEPRPGRAPFLQSPTPAGIEALHA